ncbi:hypothetical protein [Amycolatopsis acidicola]|uniref:hypothetical protein n=1 Tax=Amycolatopsis acidicola TaxID=2596893 RepID=UPI001AA08B0D|nr:hypothetical protein [Amycolatopsis acidicola]
MSIAPPSGYHNACKKVRHLVGHYFFHRGIRGGLNDLGYSVSDHVARIRLNRSERENAFTLQMVEDRTEVVNTAQRTPGKSRPNGELRITPGQNLAGEPGDLEEPVALAC